MSVQKRKKAQFREGNVPPGAMCLSSFVSITDGKNILVGKMAKPEIWIDRFFVGEQFAPKYISSGKYLLPASHLAWYESPLEAAKRVISEQARIPVPKKGPNLVQVQSFVSGDPNDEQNPPHWDICFVYEAKVPKSISNSVKTPEWFEDFGFKPKSKLKVDDFTRGHGEVLETAGLIGRTKKRRN